MRDKTQTVANPTKVKLLMWSISSPFADKLFAWSNLLLILGASAVLIGTIGAIVISGVREQFSNKQLAELGAQVASSKITVAEANANAANAMRDAENAKEATARANEGIVKLNLSIAEANSRAADAQRQAEQDRLARVKIEQLLAPRQIPDPLKKVLLAALRLTPAPVAVFVASSAPEAGDLGAVLVQLFTEAGWKPKIWTLTGLSGVRGIHIILKQGASVSVEAAAGSLVQSLNSVGIASVLEVWPQDWSQFPGMLNGPPFDAAEAEIRVFICDKP